MEVDSCESEFDTEIGVHLPVDGNLVLHTVNDHSLSCGRATLSSRIALAFEVGLQYFIAVDGFASDEFGEFNHNLNINILPSIPPRGSSRAILAVMITLACSMRVNPFRL